MRNARLPLIDVRCMTRPQPSRSGVERRLQCMLASLMRSLSILAVLIAVPLPALAAAELHEFYSVAIAPDKHHIASLQTSDDGSDSDAPASLLVRDLVGGSVAVPLQSPAGPNYKVDSPSR